MSQKSKSEDEVTESRPLIPIVGVGASAGGLEAFTLLLQHMPADTGFGMVLIQHLDPVHESALTKLLSRATSMPVREVTNNLPVEANHVYIIPPNATLTISEGVLKLQPRQPGRTPARSIDAFFESLAEDQREQAIGVILSGTATDGTIGLEAIKAEGGITFAQDDSARYESMPRSAVAAGCVDFVLSPADIAKELARIAKHPYVAGAHRSPHEDDRAPATEHENDDSAIPSGGHGTPRTRARHAKAESQARAKGGGPENGFKKILLLLRNHSGVDFSLYKSTTIQRRITRRMVLSKQTKLEDYATYLRGNTKELDALYSDALISVTSFFRNADAFEVLKRKVFPKLLQRRGDDPFRVWVLGCSMGQEAYSIAMTFVEAADKAPRLPRLQVFATDLNDALLETARHGLYAKSLAQDVSPERLRRFFVEEQGGYRIVKSLREMVVFARQNLISDPPFSRMDLISCRNLLIYLEPSLQKKALPTFHYALKPDGFLFLGASESIGGFADLFAPVDKKQKIYSKKAAPTTTLHLPARTERRESNVFGQALRPPLLPMARVREDASQGPRSELNAQREADRLTVNRFAPPGVLINSELQIIQFRGPTGAYLQPPATGKATFDVLKMAREGLMLPLRATINRAKKENKIARRENVKIHQNGDSLIVNIEVIPLKNLRERCLLILFEDGKRRAARPGSSPLSDAKPVSAQRIGKREGTRRVAELERELSETGDYLQSIQEQFEAANEELQASNEEVQSANEELQSINEELETSKEELESSNEELTTVNEEMINRNVELSRLTSDLINLQTATKLAFILLGRDLTIRRFSAQAGKQFNLLATDVGRSISSVRHNLDLADLEEFISEVISTVREREREVRDKAGRWYSLRVRPYLTVDNKVDGAVMVLVDIDALKQSEREISEARDYAEAIIETMREPLIVLDDTLRVVTANHSFYKRFHTTPETTERRFIYEVGNRQWDIPKLRALLEEILPKNSNFQDFEVTHEFEHLGLRTMLLNARRVAHELKGTQLILLAIEDVTDRKRAEEERDQLLSDEQTARNSAEAANRLKDEFLAIVSHEVRTPLNAMNGWVHLLLSGKLRPEEAARGLEVIERNTVLQARIIDELLDTSRIISGKLHLDMKPVDLADVIEPAVEVVRAAAEAKSLKVDAKLERGVGRVSGDPARLQQVFWNLLSNAVKFTPKGGHIRIRLKREESSMATTIEDNGEGIAPEFLPYVFERFRQADATTTRRQGGLGLGLSIVRNLTEMHGGRISAESKGKGQGSCFTISLPLMATWDEPGYSREASETDLVRKQSRPIDLGATRLDGFRVLIVDDELDTRDLLSIALTDSGAEVKTCSSSAEALVLIKQWKPDCIVSDIGMPNEDGYTLIKKVRALEERDGREIPAIALTGYAGAADKLRARAAGFQDHLAKPVPLQELISLIAEISKAARLG